MNLTSTIIFIIGIIILIFVFARPLPNKKREEE